MGSSAFCATTTAKVSGVFSVFRVFPSPSCKKNALIKHLQFFLHGVFCPWRAPAGGRAFGRGPVRATPATPVCGRRGRAGVARRRQKPLGRRQGRAFFPPFLWRSKERGRGGRGRVAPEAVRGLFCVLCYDHGESIWRILRFSGFPLPLLQEERFNQALAVLFARRFLPLAGACGREGFWAWAGACDSRDARVRAQG